MSERITHSNKPHADTKSRFLYRELHDTLVEKYSQASYHTLLPSERELCEHYGMSRSTVRKALQLLEEEGLAETLPGRGTFFLGSKHHGDDFVDNAIVYGNREIAFYDQVRSQGGIPTSKVLRQDIRAADEKLAQLFNIESGEPVFHLERLRYIDGNVYQLNSSCIPLVLCPDIFNRDFSGKSSLHRVIREAGYVPWRAYKTIDFEHASSYDAMHLLIPEGDAVAVTYSYTYNREGTLLEYARTRSSVYKTHFEMALFNNDTHADAHAHIENNVDFSANQPFNKNPHNP